MDTYQLIFLAASGGEGGNPLPTFIFMGAIFLVMYFFMIRPQAQKAKKQRAMIESLKKGDRVVTVGGIHGKIAKVEDDAVILEVDNNTKLKVDKSGISMDLTQQLWERTNKNNKEEKKS